MSAQPPLLQLRAREALLPRTDATERQVPIVEVLRDGEVLGQLPATKAVYEMVPNGLGTLTVSVVVARSEVTGHE